MPTYLCHGFRWQRPSIRVYVVIQNLDDASPEWIVPAKSSQCLLESFYNIFDFLPYCAPPSSGREPSIESGDGSFDFNPHALATGAALAGRSRSQSQNQSELAQSHRSRSQSQSRSGTGQPSYAQKPEPPLPSEAQGGNRNGGSDDDFTAQDWSVVKVLEEYDPMNLSEMSRPHAYVADYAVRVDLSVSIVEEMQRYEERMRVSNDPPMAGPSSDETGRKKSSKKPGWFEKLRDQLQRGEEIRWYVVVNGDEVREWPDDPEPPQRYTPASSQQHLQLTNQQHVLEHDIPPRLRGTDRKTHVPEKPLPALRAKPSLGDANLSPKTSSKGSGLRRLFGRTKPDYATSP
ncbi:hypothetical protein B0H63DRAFT_519724 [Podospora didyma]|uniref:Developmental regulator n=1 Tax=Podospora didyma TaxID=330526 RepID=A0AAE0NZB3_9PEZI|nr:hypothetical protein B0H63DRAFT_519724 [Podospora didyma]